MQAIGLAKISLILLSEFAAKCNASSVGGKRENFSPIDGFTNAKCYRTREEKRKSGRDVKIREDERRGSGQKEADSEKEKYNEYKREPESARVFQIFYFYLRWQSSQNETTPSALPAHRFFSFFSSASSIKLGTYERGGLAAAVELRSREISPKRGEPHRGVHLCPFCFILGTDTSTKKISDCHTCHG